MVARGTCLRTKRLKVAVGVSDVHSMAQRMGWDPSNEEALYGGRDKAQVGNHASARMVVPSVDSYLAQGARSICDDWAGIFRNLSRVLGGK